MQRLPGLLRHLSSAAGRGGSRLLVLHPANQSSYSLHEALRLGESYAGTQLCLPPAAAASPRHLLLPPAAAIAGAPFSPHRLPYCYFCLPLLTVHLGSQPFSCRATLPPCPRRRHMSRLPGHRVGLTPAALPCHLLWQGASGAGGSPGGGSATGPRVCEPHPQRWVGEELLQQRDACSGATWAAVPCPPPPPTPAVLTQLPSPSASRCCRCRGAASQPGAGLWAPSAGQGGSHH